MLDTQTIIKHNQTNNDKITEYTHQRDNKVKTKLYSISLMNIEQLVLNDITMVLCVNVIAITIGNNMQTTKYKKY